MGFTIFWLVVWLLCDTPQVSFGELNSWALALVVCIVIDVVGD